MKYRRFLTLALAVSVLFCTSGYAAAFETRGQALSLQKETKQPELSNAEAAVLVAGGLLAAYLFGKILGEALPSPEMDSDGAGYSGAPTLYDDDDSSDPWDDAIPLDTSIGCVWGDRAYGTCH